MLAGLNNGPGKQLVAWNSALIYDMIFTQPVVYEFGQLKVPTTLLIGDADTTAIGKDVAPPEVKARIGRYDVLGKETANKIPQARLVEFKGMGHAPQMEDPVVFHRTLLGIAEELNRSTPMQKRRSWNPSSLTAQARRVRGGTSGTSADYLLAAGAEAAGAGVEAAADADADALALCSLWVAFLAAGAEAAGVEAAADAEADAEAAGA
jgi:hypothetical protein